MGVRNTGIAYDTFEVRPMLGDLKEFSGTAPVPGGSVSVKAGPEGVKVTATVPGGTLILGDRRIPLEAGKEISAGWN